MESKKEYNIPTIQIVNINTDDVIVTSCEGTDACYVDTSCIQNYPSPENLT